MEGVEIPCRAMLRLWLLSLKLSAPATARSYSSHPILLHPSPRFTTTLLLTRSAAPSHNLPSQPRFTRAELCLTSHFLSPSSGPISSLSVRYLHIIYPALNAFPSPSCPGHFVLIASPSRQHCCSLPYYKPQTTNNPQRPPPFGRSLSTCPFHKLTCGRKSATFRSLLLPL